MRQVRFEGVGSDLRA